MRMYLGLFSTRLQIYFAFTCFTLWFEKGDLGAPQDFTV